MTTAPPPHNFAVNQAIETPAPTCYVSTISPPVDLDPTAMQSAWIMAQTATGYVQVGWLSINGVAVEYSEYENEDANVWYRTIYGPAPTAPTLFGLCWLGEGVYQIRIGDVNVSAAFLDFDPWVFVTSTESLSGQPLPTATFTPMAHPPEWALDRG